LTIFNLNGRRVSTLVQSDLSAGSHEVAWNGTDDQGRAVAGGMYLYQITARGKQQVYSDSKKMLLIR
jgi:flagellar hook assembly protein FlgD